MDISTRYSESVNMFGDLIVVRITHRNTKMCFNTAYHEIAYAIFQCFQNYNKDINIEYRNSLLGKAILINLKELPKLPPFKNIIHFYKQLYFSNLEYIEKHFNDDQLVYVRNKKEELKRGKFVFDTENEYKICHKIDLPSTIINFIMSYVYFDYKSYHKLRRKYVELEYIN